jgi:hypothetical protein
MLLGMAAGVADADLLARYNFEDGDAIDIVGGFYGTLNGQAGVIADPRGGPRGKVLTLDGDGDSVSIPKIADSIEFTYTMWINQNQIGTGLTSLITHIYWANGSIHWGLNDGLPKIGIGASIDPGGDLLGPDVIPVGQWHHVAAVKSETLLLLYVDGEEVVRRVLTRSDSVILGEAFVSNWEGGRYFNGMMDDIRIYNEAVPEDEFKLMMLDVGETSGLAFGSSPLDKETDVYREAILSWTPGKFADRHDVYFGTDFNDVNDASAAFDPAGVYQGRQDPNYYPADGTLNVEFGRRYYWRIDEVNAPPDSIIYKGVVWSFTVEPFDYPIPGDSIIATASSFVEGKEPQNTVNGSGLDESGLLHGNEGENTMWLSSPSGQQPTWIEFEFDGIYKLNQMWVWNSNEGLEQIFGLGIRETLIEYSVDGIDYTTLGTTHEFAQAPSTPDYEHDIVVDFEAVSAGYVRLTVISGWKDIFDQYGLSEVRFFYIPVNARDPNPPDGAEGVPVDVTLGFNPGREAVQHNLYYSDDLQAVIDGTEPAITFSDNQYGPLSLDLGRTYYWRIDEVNDMNPESPWRGNIWSFTTLNYLVIDDFENYSDYEPDVIWLTWIDGFGDPTNGSTTGYPNPDFIAGEHYLEKEIVHGGSWSMPVVYDNSAGISEVTRTLNTDWADIGVNKLSLWFYGDAANADEPIYIALNGSAVVPHDDNYATTFTEWMQWDIPLQAFVDRGVNLADVNTISIGFGDKASPVAGGSGIIYFDDIRLYLSQ